MEEEEEFLTRSYTQKEWTELIEQMLTYLSETNPDPNTHFFKTERQTLPNSFMTSQLSHYCYAFRGVFLPSGNSDGIVWKPSQGAKPAGKGLLKRYFYHKKDNMKINRQVIWLTSNENWCFLDYRYNFKGKIKLKDIAGPEGFNLRNLLRVSFSHLPAMVSSSGKKRSKKAQQFESSEEESLSTTEEDKLLLAQVLHSTFPSSPVSSSPPGAPEVYTDVKLEGSKFITSFEDDLFTGDFHFDNFSESALSLDIPFSPPDILEEEINTKKRPRVTSPEPQFPSPLSPSVSILPTSLQTFGSFPSWDWQWATPSNIFSSGLEYFFDMISHLICNQLMFQRRFFKKYGIDGEATLGKIQQVCIAFDPREFPGGIFRTFFEYISENYFHIKGDQLPTIYCLVCGHDIKCHDERAHREFFGHLDQSLVSSLQEKAKNMYELVKQYIIYLLKNPNSHESLKAYLMQNLHCPFCSGTNGTHVASQHSKWTNIWKIDPPAVSVPPSPSSNVYDYTKSTFEWLVDQVPFYIPPFLLSLHYAKYLRTFMECLVTCWNSVRLYL